MVLRHIPIEELLDACKRIDPNTPDLTGQVKALEDDGLTLAMALVKIADDQCPTQASGIGSSAQASRRQSDGIADVSQSPSSIRLP